MNNPRLRFAQAIAKLEASMAMLSYQCNKASDSASEFGFVASVAHRTHTAVRSNEIAQAAIARARKHP